MASGGQGIEIAILAPKLPRGSTTDTTVGASTVRTLVMAAGVLPFRNEAMKAAGSSARALEQAFTTSSTSLAKLCLSMYSWMVLMVAA